MTIVRSCITLGKILSELPYLGCFLKAVRTVVIKSDWEYSELEVLARLAEEWGNPRDDLFWAVIVLYPKEGSSVVMRKDATVHTRDIIREYGSYRMNLFPKQRPRTLVKGIMYFEKIVGPSSHSVKLRRFKVFRVDDTPSRQVSLNPRA